MSETGSIQRITVIGSGRMGMDIFNYLMLYDFELNLLCISGEEAECCRQLCQKKCSRLIKAGLMSEERGEILSNSRNFIYKPNDIGNPDLLIECIFEDAEEKKKVFGSLAKVVDEDCIMSSNSSSILPSEMADEDMRHRLFGLHFFYPLTLKGIAEITTPQHYSPEMLNRIEVFCDIIDKKTLILEEKDTFILNRLFLEVQIEAFKILQEGLADLKQIDKVVHERLFPGGIFDFFDHVGIDIMAASVRNYIRYYPDTIKYMPLLNQFDKMLTENKKGVKTGQGFYNYENNKNIADLSYGDFINSEIIFQRLKTVYLETANKIVEKGVCKKDELEYAVQEYMSTQKGPFSL